jgi:hypothetical protein
MTNVARLPGPISDLWDWQRLGNCRGRDSAQFFHPDGERGASRGRREAAAKTVCQTCPVRAQCAAHWARTGQVRHTDLAAASRRPRDAPRSPSGWKNCALSRPRQEPNRCQSHSSEIGPGSRVTLVMRTLHPWVPSRSLSGELTLFCLRNIAELNIDLTVLWSPPG